ncbi:UBN2 domain-containing protein [Tanacetum coccineum]
MHAVSWIKRKPWEIEANEELNIERDIDLSSMFKLKEHWCKAILQQKGEGYKFWASCDLYNDQCDGGNVPDNTKEKCYWEEKMELILDSVLDKLDDGWFSGTVKDKKDLDGIIDYLELKSHDGFKDIDDDAYKERMFLENQLEERERMWHSIQHGPYQRTMVPSPDNPKDQILELLSKMTEGDKKKYMADVRVMNYILQAIPNDIYNSVDACANAQEMWTRIKRLMHRFDITTTVRHSRLMDEFDKFAEKEGESLDSVYERAKKAAKTNDPLAIIAHSNASSSHLHANSFYSPQSYYVTHPPSVVDYNDEYQGELQGDSQEDKLTTAMMNQMFNAGNGSDESNQIVQRMSRTDSTPNKANVQCYNCNEKGHYARDRQKLKVCDAKYFKEQMLLAMKDEAGSHLNNEENDSMLDNAYGEESLDELTASVMLMARLQPAAETTDTVTSYDDKAVSQVHDSSKTHEQVSHEKRKTIIQTTDDDQIDSSIIFDYPYVDNNGAKKAFKERENQYLEDIVDLEEKLSSHDRINPERLKKAILAQPKMYDGDMLHSEKLIINSPDSEETLEDVEESRNQMKNKMIQVNYDKINALYETFVPQ